MEELLTKLAEQTGLDASTARNGLGAVLAFLREHLPGNLSGQVEQAVPESREMVDSFEAAKSEGGGGGGLLSAAAGMVGKALGGGGGAAASQLAGMLGAAGLSVSQIAGFLPRVLEMLRGVLPADVMAKVAGVLQGQGAGAAAAE